MQLFHFNLRSGFSTSPPTKTNLKPSRIRSPDHSELLRFPIHLHSRTSDTSRRGKSLFTDLKRFRRAKWIRSVPTSTIDLRDPWGHYTFEPETFQKRAARRAIDIPGDPSWRRPLLLLSGRRGWRWSHPSGIYVRGAKRGKQMSAVVALSWFTNGILGGEWIEACGEAESTIRIWFQICLASKDWIFYIGSCQILQCKIIIRSVGLRSELYGGWVFINR